MIYPTLTPEETSRDFIEVFGGYNHNLRIGENEFYDMKNLSSSSYPLLATRAKRRAEVETVSGNQPVGLLYCSSFLYNLYAVNSNLVLRKGSSVIWTFANAYDSNATTKEQRKLVKMGAYLIILPDKKYINLEKYDAQSQDHYPDKGDIEAEITAAANTLTIQPCLEDGTVFSVDYAGSTAPDNPADGYIWLDTSADPAVLKKWYGSNSMWTEHTGNYVRVYKQNSDIAAGFSEGDAIKVSGISGGGITFINDLAIVKAKPDDDTLVLSAEVKSTNENYTFFEVEKSNAANASLVLISEHEVSADQFVGQTFIVGNQKVVCYSNTASEAQQGWKISETIMLTNQHNYLTSVDRYQNIGSYQIGTGANLYVQLADGETMNTPPDEKYPIVIGDEEIKKKPYKIQTVDNQNAFIRLDNSQNVEVSPSTIIRPLEYGNIAGKYKFTISFTSNLTAKAGTTIMIDPDYIVPQTSAVTLARKMPVMDYVIESKNRLWGCRYGPNAAGDIVNEIYASKLGDFKSWQCYEGLSTDSYAASCGTDGEWTGAISYQGSPIFFKENYIHTVYGSYPSQYQINSTVARGVKNGCAGSLAILNETLFYLSRSGVCTYTGSYPTEISAAFGEIRYKDARAAVIDGKYYISMREDKETNPPSVLMVYDSKRGLWHKEDDLYVTHFCATDNDIEYIREGGYRGSVLGGTEEAAIQWYAESGIFGLSMIDNKYISRLNIRLNLEAKSSVSAYIEYNSSGVWERLCYISGSRLRPFTLPIKPKRCDHFRIRLEGTGNIKIYSISKTLAQGSDL